MVSGVVTRRPPLNSLGMPSRVSMALIWGPPPCTTTTRRPAKRMKATSWANASCRERSVIALPPYLTTTRASRNCSSHGSASARVAALAWAAAMAAESGAARMVVPVMKVPVMVVMARDQVL
jgi:hypothetical protein